MEDLLTESLNQTLNKSKFKHIPYAEKIFRAYNELKETKPDQIIKWGREEWDNLLGGIYGGKIYLIGADTGVGKSTFINQVCNNIAESGVKVVKYSLEDRLEDLGKEEIFYEINRLRVKRGEQAYPRVDFVNNDIKDPKFIDYLEDACDILAQKNITELDKEKQVTIDDLCELMEEEADKGAKIFAIDHLHYFEFNGSQQRLDLEIQNVMHRINEVARKRNVAILLVAHYKNTRSKNGLWPTPADFKDGASIKQVANVIIQIERSEDYDEKTLFYITKLRGPIKRFVLETDFNIQEYKYGFQKYVPKKKGEETTNRIGNSQSK